MTRQSKTNKDTWKKRKTHTVTLQSGAVVDIVIPNLPLLVKIGKIPNELLETAVSFQSKRQITREDVEEQYNFARKIVTITVVDPELTEDEVDEIPFEDVEMLVEFATRQRDIDAVGHHLGGLETVDSFRDIRGL